MMSMDNKVARLGKLGYGCGPGCTCILPLAFTLSDEEIEQLERKGDESSTPTVDLSADEYRPKTSWISHWFSDLFGRGPDTDRTPTVLVVTQAEPTVIYG